MYASTNVTNQKVVVNTASLLKFELGKLPKKVELFNESNGAYGYWTDAMLAGEFLVVVSGGGSAGKKTAAGVTRIGDPVAKTLANQGVIFTDQEKLRSGDQVTITLVDPAANSSALAITVSGTDISVSLATDGGGAITTTATLLIAAINADASAYALVAASGIGAVALVALAETPLNSDLNTILDVADEGVANPAGFSLGALTDFNDADGEVLNVSISY